MRKLFNSKKKYEQGYSEGYAKAWSEGFEVGRTKAISEFRKVMIARIEKDIQKNTDHNKNVIAGMNKAIELIRKMR
jgi:flagellar biosynthesis/type III secretory pathway protein FliH